ncbi:MAG: 30S ribosomal protein S6 [Planctomycetota bacterium]|nr:30S ribosomal protein S6 [Planctomycetota bacterium]
MAEKVYECMFIFNANAYAKNPAAAAKAVQDVTETVNGELMASRLWNEQKLAYPINGQRKGVYWLAYVKMESTSVTKFNRACKLTDIMMRHLVVGIDPRLVDTMVAVAKGEAVPDADEPAEEENATPEAAAATEG